jgi:hypothetical protein
MTSATNPHARRVPSSGDFRHGYSLVNPRSGTSVQVRSRRRSGRMFRNGVGVSHQFARHWSGVSLAPFSHARRLVLPYSPDARPHAVFSSAWGHPFDGLAGPACVADVRAANIKPTHPHLEPAFMVARRLPQQTKALCATGRLGAGASPVTEGRQESRAVDLSPAGAFGTHLYAPALLGREARKPSHISRPGLFIQER